MPALSKHYAAATLRPLVLAAMVLLGASLACAPRGRPPEAVAVGPGLARGLAVADSLVEAAVGTRYPGAVLLVAQGGVILWERAYGQAQRTEAAGRPLEAPRPMQTTILFDLASVTKVMATTMAVMLLVDRGLVDVEAPVARYLPAFGGGLRDGITVRHLLTHASGLVPWQPLYYQAASGAETLAVIRAMPLAWDVGAERHYSDLGFMLLGYLVERVSGQPLDVFLARELYGPLGLQSTSFNPKAHSFTGFAATEQGNAYERRMVYDSTFGYRYPGDPAAWDGWRQEVLLGEVNDGNAWYAHGGVAGHAGLFATAADLRVLIDLLNGRGTYQGRRYVRPEVVEQFLTRDQFEHYLGWRCPSDLPAGSFTHTGFTGTYVLGVPAYGLSVVLLTNRQHLGTDARGYFPDLGPLQQAVAQTLVRGAATDDAGRTR